LKTFFTTNSAISYTAVLTRIVFLILVTLFATACGSVWRRTFEDEAGAIRGYDPVAYFTVGKPVKGQANITAQHDGGTYHFSSEEHRDLFTNDPQRYAPQYGGYCAYAMSKGFVVSTVPEAWHIYKDKLYLNYSLGVRKTWLKKKDEYIAKADKNWAEKLRDGIED